MGSVFKYAKPYIVILIVAIGLLVVQANGDLALPEYMSKVVNNGISRGGVEYAAPDVMRENTFYALQKLVPEENREDFSTAYRKISKDTLSQSEFNKLVKKYPLLETEILFERVKLSTEKLENLSEAMAMPLLVMSSLGSSPETANLDLAALPQQAVDTIMEGAKEKMSAMSGMGATALVSAAAPVITAEYKSIGMDTDKYQMNYILMIGLQMLGFALLITAAVVTETFLASKIAAGWARDLRKGVFNKIIGFSNAEFDSFSTASLITRTTNDISQIQNSLIMMLRVVFYSPILAFGAFIKIYNSQASMSWIVGAAVALLLTMVITAMMIAIPRFTKIQKLIDRLNLVMREALSGMPVIRAFNAQKHTENNFDTANMNITKNNLFVNRLMNSLFPFMNIIMSGTSLLIVWIGASKVDQGSMQVGDMMAFIQYAMQMIMSFLMISMIAMFLPSSIISARRIAAVLNSNQKINDPEPENVKAFLPEKKGVVEFKNVSFRYSDAEDDVLHNISFKAESGKTTAFIGSTGCGKSTVINLIPRFYDATEGQVLVDGVDVRNVSQKELRSRIGYVPQKGLLFVGTIESNIKYGRDISDDEMAEYADIAQASEFIEEMPDKYNSVISQAGSNVSGGQRQRLSIARALAIDPEILIFDDSFSALDFTTDAKLRAALKKKAAGKTMLIVAQRIGTIKNVDQIIVLDEGRMVGVGTHAELLKNCQVYKEIALSQLTEEELMEGGVLA